MRTPDLSHLWLPLVSDKDYDAALAYLSLRLDADRAEMAVRRLREVDVTSRRANDLLRASGLDPAPIDDPGVHKNVLKALGGRKMSPILVVNLSERCDVADGYHRLSFSYHLDPWLEVPCKIA